MSGLTSSWELFLLKLSHTSFGREREHFLIQNRMKVNFEQFPGSTGWSSVRGFSHSDVTLMTFIAVIHVCCFRWEEAEVLCNKVALTGERSFSVLLTPDFGQGDSREDKCCQGNGEMSKSRTDWCHLEEQVSPLWIF